MCFAQRMEHHHFVDTVDELRTEVVTHHLHHRLFHLCVVHLTEMLLDKIGAQVGRHDHHGIAEIDGTALTIGQSAVIQHLQQNIEYVRVRFLDFIQQNHRIRPAAHGLREVTAPS